MSVSSIVDIVFVALLILLAVIGLYKGFLKSAISMVGSLASFLIAYVIAKPFGTLLNTIFKITSKIGAKVSKWLYSLGDFFSTVRTGEEFSNIGGEMASGNISGIVQKITNMLLKGANIPEGQSVGSVLGEKIAAIITTVIAGVVAFILIRIIIKVLEKLSDKITQVKVFGAIDKVLGFIFGLAKALLYSAAVVVVASILGYFVPAIDTRIDGVVSNTKAFQKYYDFINYHVVEFIDNKLGKDSGEKPGPSGPEEPGPETPTEISLADFKVEDLEGMAYAYVTRAVGESKGSVYFSDEVLNATNYETTGDFYVKYLTAEDYDTINSIVEESEAEITYAYAEVITDKTLGDVETLFDTITHYYVDTENKVVVFKCTGSDVNKDNYLFDCDYKVSYEEDSELDDITAAINSYNESSEDDILQTV